MTDQATKALKKKLLTRPKSPLAPDYRAGLSTGSTLLNLAMTGRTGVGFVPGSYYLLPGDSASGKTFLALTALAEACRSKHYAGYRLVYDAPERGARMDVAKFWGQQLAGRLEYRFSETVEDFYDSLDDLLKEGTPFVYVEDSESALSSQDERDKYQEQKQARRKGKEAVGSYGDGKAKKHSSNLRQVVTSKAFTASGSILLVLSQTRDNIGFGSQFTPKVRAGGRALTFYAHSEIWFSIKETIKRTVLGKPRIIGHVLQVKVKKNRDTGREPVVELHHYPSHGFDDTGSLVAFLVEEKKWELKEGRVRCPGFFRTYEPLVPEKLVQLIEDNDRETDLKLLVAETWNEIDAACAVKRKARYT